MMCLVAGSPRLRCPRGQGPFETCKGDTFLASISCRCWSAILGVPWLVDTSLPALPLSIYGFLPVGLCLHTVFSSSRKTTSPIGSGPTLVTPAWLTYICKKPYFQIRSRFLIQELGSSTYLFRGCNSLRKRHKKQNNRNNNRDHLHV